ncbi:MAG: hypothetical protein ACREC6_02955 [Hyphomicrobiaceae bacterium]
MRKTLVIMALAIGLGSAAAQANPVDYKNLPSWAQHALTPKK